MKVVGVVLAELPHRHCIVELVGVVNHSVLALSGILGAVLLRLFPAVLQASRAALSLVFGDQNATGESCRTALWLSCYTKLVGLKAEVAVATHNAAARLEEYVTRAQVTGDGAPPIAAITLLLPTTIAFGTAS